MLETYKKLNKKERAIFWALAIFTYGLAITGIVLNHLNITNVVLYVTAAWLIVLTIIAIKMPDRII